MHGNGTNGTAGVMTSSSVIEGGVYRHHRLREVSPNNWVDVPDLMYRVEGFAWHGQQRQWMVVYRLLEGPNAGALFVASLGSFTLGFWPVEQAAAGLVEPVAEKGIGYISRESGV